MTMVSSGAATRSPSRNLGPDWLKSGLTSEDAAARRARVEPAADSGQTFWAILRRNAFTRLNFLLLVLGGATLATGSAPDATFLVIALVNTVVGATQEVRAKRKLDALAVINAPKARVIRDGAAIDIAPGEVVVDDLLDLRTGDQVTADAMVVADRAEVDESLNTGESEPVDKTVGDNLTSGSWVVAGSLLARVTGTGADSYANRLAAQARRYSLANSELMSGINFLLRWLTVIMAVIAPILLYRQLQQQPWRQAVRGAVAGLVGMIPEGLILLTTLAFLAAAVRLSRRNVLVQELPAVETLARVDALCVDKTGTLTEGGITFAGLQADPPERSDVEAALASMAGQRAANATMKAIGSGLDHPAKWELVDQVPFNSSRKWSAASFAGHGTWVVGAPEMIRGNDPDGRLAEAAKLAGSGARVVVVARTDQPLHEEQLPDGLRLVGTVELHETPRPAVATTLRYFADQDVTVRVISGDSPATVQALADQVGLQDADRAAVDARSMGSERDEIGEEVERGRIFGRVTPDQKQAMVAALQRHDHTVAMTGDGVNDVLALKTADLGIAMGSGSAITKGVAQLVLLDNDFDVLPSVVAEGRRVLANIEVVAGLFLVKNMYSLLISVATAITGWPYPFLPRHLTLISAVAIGIPGFFLALGPNPRRFTPGFTQRVLTFAALAGSLAALAVFVTYAVARAEGSPGDAARTAAVVAAGVISLWVLAIVSRPLTKGKVLLVAAMAVLFAAAFVTPGVNKLFSVDQLPGMSGLVEAFVFGAMAALAIDVLLRIPWVRRRWRDG